MNNETIEYTMGRTANSSTKLFMKFVKRNGTVYKVLKMEHQIYCFLL